MSAAREDWSAYLVPAGAYPVPTGVLADAQTAARRLAAATRCACLNGPRGAEHGSHCLADLAGDVEALAAPLDHLAEAHSFSDESPGQSPSVAVAHALHSEP